MFADDPSFPCDEEKLKPLRSLLSKFGWRESGASPQFLLDGNCAHDETIFLHEMFNSSAFALCLLVDRKRGRYAAWGFYEEGKLTEWGMDEAELLALLTSLHGRVKGSAAIQ